MVWKMGVEDAVESSRLLCISSGVLGEWNSAKVRGFLALQHCDIRRHDPGGYTRFPDLANGPWPLQLTLALSRKQLVLMSGS